MLTHLHLLPVLLLTFTPLLVLMLLQCVPDLSPCVINLTTGLSEPI